MRVIWKPIIMHSLEGKPCAPSVPKTFSNDPLLFDKIQAMPKGTPVGLAAAFNMYWYEIMSNVLDDDGDSKLAGEITNQDWVKWISKQGFQIILRGDEYDGN